MLPVNKPLFFFAEPSHSRQIVVKLLPEEAVKVLRTRNVGGEKLKELVS